MNKKRRLLIIVRKRLQSELQIELPLGNWPQRNDLSTFNPSMLALAREAEGLTQEGLAELVHCHQGRISKIESGELVPQQADIEQFVSNLHQPKTFFFRGGTAKPPSVSLYRKRLTLPLKILTRCNAKMNIKRLEIEDLVGSKKLGKRELPHLSPEAAGGAKGVAQKARQLWGLNKGPVRNLIKLVEDIGCVVIDYSFPSAKLDGLFVRGSSEKPPIVFLNKDLAKSRKRLSLAHELGHLLMHTDPHEGIEEEAWDFAGEFLMPAEEIASDLERLNIDKLGNLKKTWGVSMQALLKRATTLGRINESHARFLWIQIGKSGYRVNEPFEDSIPDETPTRLEDRLKA
jgi:Zn-dependent peptidase ImmA (M78 family)/transcriptional regulator with XRE-family HTH domain